jgi:hypothetical protein
MAYFPNNIDGSLMEVQGGNDTDIRTSHASICPSIHERAGSGGGDMVGKITLSSMSIDAMKEQGFH